MDDRIMRLVKKFQDGGKGLFDNDMLKMDDKYKINFSGRYTKPWNPTGYQESINLDLPYDYKRPNQTAEKLQEETKTKPETETAVTTQTTSTTPTTPATPTSNNPTDTQSVIFNSLTEKFGFTPQQIAGLMSNINAESAFKTGAENAAEKAGKNTAVDSSKYGIGLLQWTNTRHTDLENYANANGGNKTDLNTQVNFMMDELNKKYSNFVKNLKMVDNAEDAATLAFVQYIGGTYTFNAKDKDDLMRQANAKAEELNKRYQKKHSELGYQVQDILGKRKSDASNYIFKVRNGGLIKKYQTPAGNLPRWLNPAYINKSAGYRIGDDGQSYEFNEQDAYEWDRATTGEQRQQIIDRHNQRMAEYKAEQEAKKNERSARLYSNIVESAHDVTHPFSYQKRYEAAKNGDMKGVREANEMDAEMNKAAVEGGATAAAIMAIPFTGGQSVSATGAFPKLAAGLKTANKIANVALNGNKLVNMYDVGVDMYNNGVNSDNAWKLAKNGLSFAANTVLKNNSAGNAISKGLSAVDMAEDNHNFTENPSLENGYEVVYNHADQITKLIPTELDDLALNAWKLAHNTKNLYQSGKKQVDKYAASNKYGGLIKRVK